jgi:beta-lactamase superfamily II metal-dependent hydrolase
MISIKKRLTSMLVNPLISLVPEHGIEPRRGCPPGDIKTRAEYELVSTAGDKLNSTVLLVPHHGSKTSSSDWFVETVNPAVVIISSRWRSRFGFPHPSVLKRYQKIGCRVLSTARNGAVSMSTNGRTLTIRPTVTDKKVSFDEHP